MLNQAVAYDTYALFFKWGRRAGKSFVGQSVPVVSKGILSKDRIALSMSQDWGEIEFVIGGGLHKISFEMSQIPKTCR